MDGEIAAPEDLLDDLDRGTGQLSGLPMAVDEGRPERFVVTDPQGIGRKRGGKEQGCKQHPEDCGTRG